MDAIPQITAAVVVVVLLGILWWSSKKTQGGSIGWLNFSVRGNRAPQGAAAKIQVLGRSHLTANHQLHLVQSMEQVFLICTHSAGTSVISSQPVAVVSNGAASQDDSR
jgi:hypothetical protein